MIYVWIDNPMLSGIIIFVLISILSFDFYVSSNDVKKFIVEVVVVIVTKISSFINKTHKIHATVNCYPLHIWCYC